MPLQQLPAEKRHRSPISIGAVVLAAGGSARFGKPKQLAIFRGKTFVRRIVAVANEAECAPIVVVVGRDAAQITSELAGLPVSIAVHRNWSNGLGSSIAAGVRHAVGVAPNLNAAILLTCDQPFVNAAALRQLIQLHLESGKTIVTSAYAETLGIPALFDRSCFGDLLQLTGDSGAKRIIRARRHDVTPFNFPAAAIDIDTAEDYGKLRDGEGRVQKECKAKHDNSPVNAPPRV
jgi:molybdenum cofactor cytidylyltransferase